MSWEFTSIGCRIARMVPEQVAVRYGAKDVDLRLIRSGQGGATIFEATVDGTRHALRLSGPFLSARPQWIEFEGSLLARLKSAKVPVAAAVRGVDGQFGQAQEGGVALLTEWAEGDVEWPTPPEKAFKLGRAIGRMHLLSSDFHSPNTARSFDTEGLLNRPLALLAEVADPEPLRPFVDILRERIEAIPRTSVTYGPIHGDIHQGNCHFDDDRVTLFDFAQCGIGWRAFDLAGFLWPWRDESIQNPDLKTACSAYLAGYRSERKLSDEEERALPAFVRARDLWEAGEWVATGDAREKPEHVAAGIQSWVENWAANPIHERLE